MNKKTSKIKNKKDSIQKIN